jgi:glutamate/tyrosine decarboxylase-like PLP-dependent enzyme
MEELLRNAAERAILYLQGLGERRVAPDPSALAHLREFDRALPSRGVDAEAVLALLDEVGSPGTIASASGRFFGFVVGGALPATLAANWLAGAWDQNAGMVALSPVGAVLEEVSLKWLVDLLGLPEGTGGGFVTGATMANFTALAAARHALLSREGWDVEARGLFGAPPITVVVGEEVHVSVLKALGLLGLGRDRVVRVRADAQGRMDSKRLPAVSGPTIICIQAGNVNTGAFDPAAEICGKAHEGDAWVHVDGAFGLWAATSPFHAHLSSGLKDADSWATDAHKWLNVPYDSGLAFVREPAHLSPAMAATAAYLLHSESREPDLFTPELSRRARGVEVWAALLSLGRSGVADLIERTCGHARRFAEGLTAQGWVILNDVVLNQVLACLEDDDTTRRVVNAIQSDGTCWCGPTVWKGRTAMRVSVSSWATTSDDVERSLQAIGRVRERLRRA